MRLPKTWHKPLDDGRLLVLSPFPRSVRRATAATAEDRNRFAARLADEILFAYAAPDSSTERFKEELSHIGRTIASPAAP